MSLIHRQLFEFSFCDIADEIAERRVSHFEHLHNLLNWHLFSLRYFEVAELDCLVDVINFLFVHLCAQTINTID